MDLLRKFQVIEGKDSANQGHQCRNKIFILVNLGRVSDEIKKKSFTINCISRFRYLGA